MVMQVPAGWYPDPWRQAPMRWWDGGLWTSFVAPRPGPVGVDPAGGGARAAGAERKVLPLPAAGVAIASFAAVLVTIRLALGMGGAGAHPMAAVLAAVGLQYAAMGAICVWTCRRWADGDVVSDLGLAFRPADLGWAAIAWLVAVIGTARVIQVLQQLGVPYATNNPFTDGRRDGPFLSHGASLVLAAVVMIVCAPLFEELLFRGVVLRALRSRMAAMPAVALQGLVFGAFHFEPSRGVGNIGLVIALSGMGMVFGFLAERTGRLGAGVIAHAIQNGVVFLAGVALT
jgi:membrane protease YdiL (CAAX protease family)